MPRESIGGECRRQQQECRRRVCVCVCTAHSSAFAASATWPGHRRKWAWLTLFPGDTDSEHLIKALALNYNQAKGHYACYSPIKEITQGSIGHSHPPHSNICAISFYPFDLCQPERAGNSDFCKLKAERTFPSC